MPRASIVPDGICAAMLWYCPSVHSQALPLLPLPQLCVAKQIADDVCGKHSAFGVIAGQEFHRAEPVIFVLPRRFNFVLPVHTFSLVESPFSRIRGRDSRYEQLSQCLDAALISAALHYGLPYGCSPATGNFQRLRGRPPLVSPLKSCRGCSFTAVAMGRIAIGTAYAPRSFSSRNR